MLFLKALLNSLIRLLPGQSLSEKQLPPPASYASAPSELSEAPVPEVDMPSIPAPTLVSGQTEGVPCTAMVLEALGMVNMRSGPGLTYHRVERAAGGMVFGVAGISGPDPDGFPWYWVDWDGGSGWVRGDLVTLSGACEAVGQNVPVEPEGPAAPPPAMTTGRLFLPTPHRMVQGYHGQHEAYDLAAPLGTAFRAAARGVVIRRVACSKCTPEQPNILPSSLTPAQRQDLFNDPDWGYGYGNFLIVRYAYADLPVQLRSRMDVLDLTGGFAYVLYAHLSRIDAELGNRVDDSVVLGATGNTGLSSGPRLHLEVRVGRDETVDSTWLRQQVVHPNLMFRENPD